MKRFTNSRKFLFGVSVSMVLAMAIGSFALGENQTPVSPQEVEAQNSVGATVGPFTVDGGTQGTDYEFTGTSGTNGVLTIHPQSIGTNITISNTGTTTDRIEVTSAATITLNNVNIAATNGAALAITDNATFDVNILLADGSTNILKGKVGSNPINLGSPGIQKNGSGDSIGTLTIGVPSGSAGTGTLEATGGYDGAGIGGVDSKSTSSITISGGEVTATGGYCGAGIGGGNNGDGSDITINGGVVKATGGLSAAGIGGGWGAPGTGKGNARNITISGGEVTATGGQQGAGIGGGERGVGSEIEITGGVVKAYGRPNAAGIGGGDSGSGSGNSLNGDAVVLATSGKTDKPALDGFADSDLNRGITFTRQGTSGIWSGMMYGNSVKITEDVEFPADLTISANKQVTVGENKTLTIPKNVTLTTESGATLTVANRATLKNDGTVIEGGTVVVGGTIITKTDFHLDDDSLYNTGYQTYRTSAGIQKYKNLPNPYQLDPANGKRFINWYYRNQASQKVAISGNVNVLLNEHNFHENTVYTVTVAELENGIITKEVTEAAKDDTVTFTATPDEGYRIVGLPVVGTEDGTDITVTAGADGEYTFTMPNAAVEISAIFEGIPYEISVIQPEHGTIDLDTEEAIIGTEINFTATPDEGYRIVGLPVVETEDGTEITVTAREDGEYTFTMPNAAVEISAIFEGIPYTVTFDSKGGSEVTSQTVAYDNTVQEPDEPIRDGYSFVEWCEDEECTTAWDFENDKVQGDMTLYAKWLGDEHKVTIPTSPDDHGTVTTDPENPKTGDEVIITVTPEEGYEIDGLPIVKTEDGRIIEVIPTGNPNEYKFIMPDSDVTIEVNFVLISEPTVDPGVKTGDSFAGIAALAVLSVATTGAVLVRKRK